MSLIVTVVLASLLGSFLCSLCEASLFALAMLLLTEIVPKGVGVVWAGTLAPRLS